MGKTYKRRKRNTKKKQMKSGKHNSKHTLRKMKRKRRVTKRRQRGGMHGEAAAEELLLTDNHLITYASKGNLARVTELLEKGTDPNQANRMGLTPLMVAVLKNNGSNDNYETIINLLLEKGEDVNATDKNGQTVLMKAVQKGNVSVVKLLLDNGATVNHRVIELATQEAIEKMNSEVLNAILKNYVPTGST